MTRSVPLSACRACTGAPPRRSQRGAALLIAMVLLTLVATLASGMIWQQWRGVQVEAAERSRTQTAWILSGALDYARLILREDARSGKPTSLDQPWASPLAEARLSTFLATDRDNNADSGPDAFLSGSIADAQSRYNLRNLVAAGKVVPAELAILHRLCAFASVPTAVADRLAEGLLAATLGSDSNAPLAPQRLDQLTWLGIDAGDLRLLTPMVALLPVAPTPVNLNTASREVLAAVLDGIGLGGADRLVQARQRQPFRSNDEAQSLLPSGIVLDAHQVGVNSSYFEVTGHLRLEDRVLEELSLVRRDGLEVVPLQRRRSRAVESGAG
jgi:general secretion pathway protein K